MNVYRFHDQVRVNIDMSDGTSKNLQLNNAMAIALSDALRRYAWNIKERPFANSTLGVTEL